MKCGWRALPFYPQTNMVTKAPNIALTRIATGPATTAAAALAPDVGAGPPAAPDRLAFGPLPFEPFEPGAPVAVASAPFDPATGVADSSGNSWLDW